MKQENGVEEHQRYYDAYWANHDQRLNAHEITRLAEILRGIALITENTGKTPMKICDLGCGRGWISNELSKFGSVIGVDLSETGVSGAQTRWPNVEYRVADITKWRPDEKFDLVVSSEVIEHVPDQQAFSQTVRHLLRDGGHIILTTPNAKVKKGWDAGAHGAQLVEQWLSLKGLRDLFPGLTVLDQHTFIFDFSYQGIFRVTSAPKILSVLKKLGVIPLYDAARNMFNMGLYQIMVGKYPPPK